MDFSTYEHGLRRGGCHRCGGIVTLGTHARRTEGLLGAIAAGIMGVLLDIGLYARGVTHWTGVTFLALLLTAVFFGVSGMTLAFRCGDCLEEAPGTHLPPGHAARQRSLQFVLLAGACATGALAAKLLLAF